jgi:hypothetical protein
LREHPRPVSIPAIIGGFIVGALAFGFAGLFINALAMSGGPHVAAAIDLGIVLVLGAGVVALIATRRLGNGFVVGLLVGMLGGFAVCSGMLASSPS